MKLLDPVPGQGLYEEKCLHRTDEDLRGWLARDFFVGHDGLLRRAAARTELRRRAERARWAELDSRALAAAILEYQDNS